MSGQFAFEGNLELTVDGVSAHVSAQERDITVDVDRPVEFVRAALASMGGLPKKGLYTAREAAQTLYELGITVRLVRKGQTLLTMGRHAQAGLSGFVVPHMQIGAIEIYHLLTG